MNALKMIIWQEKYSVGIDLLDRQHQQIIDLINCLFSVRATVDARAMVIQTFKDLVRYTEIHFENEEELMQLHHYADIENHKAVHRKMITQTRKIQKESQETGGDFSLETIAFLKEWWLGHIMTIDRKYIPCLTTEQTQ